MGQDLHPQTSIPLLLGIQLIAAGIGELIAEQGR